MKEMQPLELTSRTDEERRQCNGRLIESLCTLGIGLVDALAPKTSLCSVCNDLEPVGALRRCELPGCFCEHAQYCIGCLSAHTRKMLEEIGWNPQYVKKQLDQMGL